MKPCGTLLGLLFSLNPPLSPGLPSLGFLAILQTPSDLGCGISFLDFSARSSVSLLPHSPLPPFKRGLGPAPRASVFPASCFSGKHSPSPHPATASTPLLQGRREGCAFFETGLQRASFLLAADLFPVPVPSAPPAELLWPCGVTPPVLCLSLLQWEPAVWGISSEACFPSPGGGGLREERVHLLAGLAEPILSFSSCFKRGFGFQLAMRGILG